MWRERERERLLERGDRRAKTEVMGDGPLEQRWDIAVGEGWKGVDERYRVGEMWCR